VPGVSANVIAMENAKTRRGCMSWSSTLLGYDHSATLRKTIGSLKNLA